MITSKDVHTHMTCRVIRDGITYENVPCLLASSTKDSLTALVVIAEIQMSFPVSRELIQQGLCSSTPVGHGDVQIHRRTKPDDQLVICYRDGSETITLELDCADVYEFCHDANGVVRMNYSDVTAGVDGELAEMSGTDPDPS